MKKLIAILFVMLIVPSLGYSAYRVISKFSVIEDNYLVRVLCIDGHKFVYLNEFVNFNKDCQYEGISNSIVQMYEERDGNHYQLNVNNNTS